MKGAMALDALPDLTTLQLDEVRSLLDKLQSRFNATKIAYLNSTELDGAPVTYEDVAVSAKQVIKVNYRLQELLYGKVRLKLTVEKLIRRGR